MTYRLSSARPFTGDPAAAVGESAGAEGPGREPRALTAVSALSTPGPSGNATPNASAVGGRIGCKSGVFGGQRINLSDFLSRHSGSCELRGLGRTKKEEGEGGKTSSSLSPIRLSPTPCVALLYSSQAFPVPNPRCGPGFERVLTKYACRLEAELLVHSLKKVLLFLAFQSAHSANFLNSSMLSSSWAKKILLNSTPLRRGGSWASELGLVARNMGDQVFSSDSAKNYSKNGNGM